MFHWGMNQFGCWKDVFNSVLFWISNWYLVMWGTRWHCATTRKVAGLIPDRVIGIFHWLNPSGRTTALGSTQPVTEMSTRNISWGAKAAGAYGWQPYHLHVLIVLKSGSLNLQEPSGPVQVCRGIALSLSHYVRLFIYLLLIYRTGFSHYQFISAPYYLFHLLLMLCNRGGQPDENRGPHCRRWRRQRPCLNEIFCFLTLWILISVYTTVMRWFQLAMGLLGRSPWRCGLKRRSAAARLLGSQFRIPLRACMFVSYVCCVL